MSNITLTWQQLKAWYEELPSVRRLRSFDLTDSYLVIALDDIITAQCIIIKEDPASSDQIDFETNYLTLTTTVTEQYSYITDGTDNALVTASGELSVLSSPQPGVDIGDVTVNNASGASAVNIQDGGNSITVDGNLSSTQSGTWDINDITGTVSLPTGASTSALQTTGNTSLSSIDTKLNTLGQKTSANSVPIVIASDQSNINTQPPNNEAGSLDRPTLIAGKNSTGTGTFEKRTITTSNVAVDGDGNDVYALAVKDYSGGARTSASGSITNTQTVSLSGNGNPTIYIDVSGTWTGSLDVKCPFPSAPQIITFRKVGSYLPQTTITNNGLYIIEEGVIDSLDVIGNTISSGTANVFIAGVLQTQGTHAWQSGSWSVDINNASGASAVNIQDGGNSITVDGTVNAVQSGTWNITNVSGTVSLPTGASTSALQTTGNTSLSSIDTKIPSNLTVTSTRLLVDGSGVTQPVSGALTDAELRATPVPITGSISATNPSVSTTDTTIPGSATMVGGSDGTNLRALKVSSTGVLSTDGSATTQPVSAVSLPLPTGAATAALQTQPGVDIGDVTINNASGASAVNIQDGGNSITVDGSVTATQATASNLNAQVVGPGASGAAVSGNPVRSAGSDGTNTRDMLTDTSGRQVVVGAAASGAAKAGNPVQNGGVFNTTPPTVTNGQAVELQTTARGMLQNHPATVIINAAVSAHPTTVGPSDTTYQTCHVSLTGTFVGSLTPQYSFDNVTWSPTTVTTGSGSVFTSLTSALHGTIDASAAYFRLVTSSWTSGTANINLTLTNNVDTVYVKQKSPAFYSFTAKTRPDIPTLNRTYSASVVGLVSAALPTDIFTLTGSASTTVYITRVTVSATQTTAAVRDVVFLKRSTANTGGTSTTRTAVVHDSAFTAATATCLAYTVNPTLGTLVGNIATHRLPIGTATTVTPAILTREFGAFAGTQPIVLRGTSQVFAVNMNGVTSAGNLFDITIEWMEV